MYSNTFILTYFNFVFNVAQVSLFSFSYLKRKNVNNTISAFSHNGILMNIMKIKIPLITTFIFIIFMVFHSFKKET